MYGSSGSSSIGLPPPPSPDDGPPAVMANPRYLYLLGRLRNRQITMEEATELFGLQQQLIASAMAARAPPPPTTPSGTQAVASPARSDAGIGFNDDSLALSLLAIGAGAGILAAVMKRAQEGPKKPSG